MTDYASYDYKDSGRFSKLREHMPTRATITRLLYCSILVVGYVAALIMRNGFYGLIAKVPAINRGCEVTGDNLCSGNAAVYRVSFSMALFFFINMFLASPLFCVPLHIKVAIQHRFWWIKVPVFIVFLIFPFFIPNIFFTVWAWISIFVSALFIILQIIVFIDFAYEWNKSWVEKDEKKWYAAILFFAIVFYVAGLGLAAAEYALFGSKPSCHLNRFFITMPIVLAVFYTILSLRVEHGALLPSALVFVFSAFSVWSALSSYPFNSDEAKNCNILSVPADSTSRSKAVIPTIVMGSLFAALSLFRSVFSVSSSSSAKGLLCCCAPEDEEEEDKVECRMLFFAQVMFFLASFYTGMLITGWDITNQSDSEALKRVDEGYVAVGVKLGSMFLCVTFYFWSLIAPYVLKNRDFDY